MLAQGFFRFQDGCLPKIELCPVNDTVFQVMQGNLGDGDVLIQQGFFRIF